MEKNYAVQVVKDGKTRFLANDISDGLVVNMETMEVKLILSLSPVPVAMTRGDADFWVDRLQEEQGGVIIEAKALRDIDLESLDTH